jgi:hypothetical protein
MSIISEKACKACLKQILIDHALCCANALSMHSVWEPCKGYWCHGCDQLDDDGMFPIQHPYDEEGYAVILEKDKEHFCLEGKVIIYLPCFNVTSVIFPI